MIVHDRCFYLCPFIRLGRADYRRDVERAERGRVGGREEDKGGKKGRREEGRKEESRVEEIGRRRPFVGP